MILTCNRVHTHFVVILHSVLSGVVIILLSDLRSSWKVTVWMFFSVFPHIDFLFPRDDVQLILLSKYRDSSSVSLNEWGGLVKTVPPLSERNVSADMSGCGLKSQKTPGWLDNAEHDLRLRWKRISEHAVCLSCNLILALSFFWLFILCASSPTSGFSLVELRVHSKCFLINCNVIFTDVHFRLCLLRHSPGKESV